MLRASYLRALWHMLTTELTAPFCGRKYCSTFVTDVPSAVQPESSEPRYWTAPVVRCRCPRDVGDNADLDLHNLPITVPNIQRFNNNEAGGRSLHLEHE